MNNLQHAFLKAGIVDEKQIKQAEKHMDAEKKGYTEFIRDRKKKSDIDIMKIEHNEVSLKYKCNNCGTILEGASVAEGVQCPSCASGVLNKI